MIWNIQALRFFAALSVAYVHIATLLSIPLVLGVYGVDLFFVISGFLMPLLIEREQGHFLLRRVIRIVPFYWSMTILVYLMALLFPRVFHSISADPHALVRSLLFLPYDDRKVPGPLIEIGWTLNYEMYFYALFAIALHMSRRFATPITGLALVVLLLLFTMLGDAAGPLRFYSNSIVLEFIFGIGCYYIWLRVKKTGAVQDRRMRLLVLTGLAVGLICLPLGERICVVLGVSRPLAIGIPAFTTLLCVVLLEQMFAMVVRAKMILMLGGLSYVMYLTHSFLAAAALRLMPGFLSASGRLPLLAGLIAVCLAASLLVELYYERPLRAFLARMLLPRPPAA